MRDRWLSLATRIARKSNDRYKLGAVIVKGGRVLSVANNDGHRHAETRAIMKASDCEGAELYVSRVTAKGGTLACSMPCPNCADAVRKAGISKVTYLNGEGEWTPSLIATN